MSQPNQNNFRGMLDELSAASGEAAYDKNNGWEKLYTRLEQRPSRNKQIWYWAAASFILAASVFVVTLTSKNTVLSVTGIALQKEIIFPHNITTLSKEISVVHTIAPVPEKEPAIIALHKKVQDVASVMPVKPLHPAEPVITGSPATRVQLPEIAATLPVIKSLSVVHNNDLEDEDRIASQNGNNIRAVRSDTKNTAKKGYASIFNFRIYLKN